MNCEHIESCTLLLHMGKSLPFTVTMMRIKYCEFSKNKCARYKLRHLFEMESIPDNLWPGDELKEMELLDDKLDESRKNLYG
jgi:hypothetical protein